MISPVASSGSRVRALFPCGTCLAGCSMVIQFALGTRPTASAAILCTLPCLGTAGLVGPLQLTRHPGLILCQLQLGLSSWSWASHFRAPRGPLLHPLLPSGPRLRGAPVAPSPAVLLRLFLRLWRPVASAVCRLISSGHLCQAIFCLM